MNCADFKNSIAMWHNIIIIITNVCREGNIVNCKHAITYNIIMHAEMGLQHNCCI